MPQLTSFQSGILIAGGDFNVALIPAQDTSTGASSMTFRALSSIKNPTWRLNPPRHMAYTTPEQTGLHILLPTTQVFQDQLLLSFAERLNTPLSGNN